MCCSGLPYRALPADPGPRREPIHDRYRDVRKRSVSGNRA
ncbi:hypothetical protein SCATT_30810 [Streptantibioticus cattleyicolor NRRL 8057 = DSM 46488]|uniref:Uncharacterized protein n=1 Tax=Streptantibioticus cattleyicolor (strain ATCC 35852 / DSM 46488 / JCM 4925 / NBRC 14057 / NRRL 8057) TaxID=1003195 RepID=G8WWT7_STREN|nr:hypothetical protein SCATT_30810 [Streptantibioticus cattleyicolor NRRL 8057 = DSM 46488]